MGLWWEEVTKDVPWDHCVTFAGDPSALSKSVPLVWRFNQDWHSLEYHEFEAGYRLYFEHTVRDIDVSVVMRFRRVLRTRYVMVRIGPEPVNFWAEDLDGRPGELLKTNVMVPGNRWRKDTTPIGYDFRSQRRFGTHTWV